MKNSDMPAMPLSGDAYEDFAHYDGTKNTSHNPQCQGLTKREHFAGLAMQGILSNHVTGDADLHSSHNEWLNDISQASVEFADELLKQLGE